MRRRDIWIDIVFVIAVVCLIVGAIWCFTAAVKQIRDIDAPPSIITTTNTHSLICLETVREHQYHNVLRIMLDEKSGRRILIANSYQGGVAMLLLPEKDIDLLR